MQAITYSIQCRGGLYCCGQSGIGSPFPAQNLVHRGNNACAHRWIAAERLGDLSDQVLLLLRRERIAVLLVNGHGCGAAHLLIVAQARWRKALLTACRDGSGRAIASEWPHAVGCEWDIGSNQVSGMGGSALDAYGHRLCLFVECGDRSFQVNDFGCAPVDALSTMENHCWYSSLVCNAKHCI